MMGARGHLAIVVALFSTVAPAQAEGLVATRTMRAGDTLGPADVRLDPSLPAGALDRADAAVGLVARRMLVAGRAIMPGDVGPPPAVHRNSPVTLLFRSGGLTISAEGRALADAAIGDPVRALNMTSRQTVSGTVSGNGEVTMGAWR
jgi:flagellar basal body P-ring formation protein FlgA